MNTKQSELTQRKYKKIIYIQTGVFVLLFLGLGIFMFAHDSNSKEIKKAVSNPYPLLDPYRQFTNRDDLLLNLQPLRNNLNQLVAEQKDFKVSLYYEQLNTGGNISVNPDLRLFSASLQKLPIALAVAKKIEIGEWGWDDQLVLLPQDKDEKSGQLYLEPIYTRFTIEQLLRELLVNSDNTAYAILNRNLTSDDKQRLIEEIGFEDLYDKMGKATAKEYTKLIRTIYVASFLNRENSSKILQMLTEGGFKEYLSQGIPQEITFAHKYGENIMSHTEADTGIVYLPDRPYMVTVLIEMPNQEEATVQRGQDLMKNISKTIYEFMAQ